MAAAGDGPSDGRWGTPHWDYPEYPPGSVVEIRVHGVGGEPPSGMTRDPFPVQVAGDDLAGFWRARDPVVGPLPDAAPSSDATPGHAPADGEGPLHVREVLSWGGQTSGTFRHALWVLLLPFSLGNLAGRMQPYPLRGEQRRRARWYRMASRLLAYTMTLTATALATGIAFDLLGAQCADATGCLVEAGGTGRWLLAPIRAFIEHPAAMMAVLAVVPVLVIVALWTAGKYRTHRLEGRRSSGGQTSEPVRLDEPAFWQNAWPTSRLRGTHATGAFAFVGLALSLILFDLTGRGVWIVGVAASALVTVLCGLLVCWPRMLWTRPDPALGRGLKALRLAAFVPLAAAAGIALHGAEEQALPPWLAALLIVLSAAALVLWWRNEAPPRQSGPASGTDDAVAGPDTRLIGAAVLAAGLAGAAIGAAALSDAVARLTDAEPGAFIRDWERVPGAFGWLPDPVLAAFEGLYLPAYLPVVALVVVQAVLLVALALLGVMRRTTPDRTVTPPEGHDVRAGAGGPLAGPAVAYNLGGPLVVLLGLLILVSVAGSLHAIVLGWLGGADADGALRLPWWYAVTVVFSVIVAPAVLVVVVAARAGWDLLRGWLPAWRWLRRWGPVRPPVGDAGPGTSDVREELLRGFPVEGDPRLAAAGDGRATQQRLSSIGSAWRTALHVRAAGNLLLAAMFVTGLVFVGYLVFVRYSERALTDPPWLTRAGVVVATALTFAAVDLVRRAVRERSARRQIGRLWDVINFWPRVTHPFAPPCYGEAVVPMLRDRMTDLLGATKPVHGNGQRRSCNYRVVLAGHSQGSVLALAAVLALPRADEVRERVALVTYGSPIGILYERHFRALVGTKDGAVVRAADNVHSWHHFFTLTEPFGLPLWLSAEQAGRWSPRTAWRTSVDLPHADRVCAACGWSREWSPSDDVAVTPAMQRCIDYVVTDPQQWLRPLDSAPRPLKGHSTYHDSREMDEHLSCIAATLSGRATARSPASGSRARRSGWLGRL